MLKSHSFFESKNHRVRCAPPVRHCPAGPPARKRTRGGTSGSNRGPASRTWGGYAQKGRGTGGSNRGPAATTRAPPAIAKFLQRHRGPNNFYRPASTLSLIMNPQKNQPSKKSQLKKFPLAEIKFLLGERKFPLAEIKFPLGEKEVSLSGSQVSFR